MSHKQTVFVGLSGGVDSSVAALRLLTQGYRVVGVFIKVWQPDFLVCNWEQERLDAMRVAAKLGIPFLTCDAESIYRDTVATYFIESYRSGYTPNPDVMCNKEVKFGVFLDFALTHGADYIATGHYAQNHLTTNGHYQLTRSIDSNKDQSYFLWTLTEIQLAHTIFPIGHTTKEEVRHEANAAGLLTANKKDSQGVCFLGHIDIHDFLSHYIHLIPGVVYDESGVAVGEHRGALVYTIGQRHGFTLTSHDKNRPPYYIIAKDCDRNTLTVSRTKPVLSVNKMHQLQNIMLRHALPCDNSLVAQTRYRQTPFRIKMSYDQTNTYSTFEALETTDAVAAGQSCVLYQDNICLGGGIII